MGMLTQEAVEEYRQIYKKKFNKEITFEEAREQGEQLIELMKLIYEPISFQKMGTMASERF